MGIPCLVKNIWPSIVKTLIYKKLQMIICMEMKKFISNIETVNRFTTINFFKHKNYFVKILNTWLIFRVHGNIVYYCQITPNYVLFNKDNVFLNMNCGTVLS